MTQSFYFAQATDEKYSIRRQLRSTMKFATGMVATIALLAFLVIGLLCAQMQVKWVDTSSGVTGMKHVQPFRDWAVVNLPREAMRGIDAFQVGVVDAPVTVLVQRSMPEPATVINHYPFLEPLLHRWTWTFYEGLQKPVATITTAPAKMTKPIVVAICADNEMTQSHTANVVAPVANSKTVLDWSIEIEPMPSGRKEIPAIISEQSTATVICAAYPNPALPQSWITRRNRAITVNVLEESKNGMYEFSGHGHNLLSIVQPEVLDLAKQVAVLL